MYFQKRIELLSSAMEVITMNDHILNMLKADLTVLVKLEIKPNFADLEKFRCLKMFASSSTSIILSKLSIITALLSLTDTENFCREYSVEIKSSAGVLEQPQKGIHWWENPVQENLRLLIFF